MAKEDPAQSVLIYEQHGGQLIRALGPQRRQYGFKSSLKQLICNSNRKFEVSTMPTKHSCGHQLIHRHLTRTKSIGMSLSEALQTTALILCHAEVLQATASEVLAQGPYV